MWYDMNEELKIWIISISVLSVTFTNVIDVFKIALLVASFTYTAFKLFYLINDRKDKKD